MKSILAYVVPGLATWTLINYDWIPERFVAPIAVLVLLITGIIMVLEAGLELHLRKGSTEKCRKLWSQMEKDIEFWDKKNSVWMVLILLVFSVLFSNYFFTTVLFSLGTVYALVLYLGYTGDKYNDNFSDPGGFV